MQELELHFCNLFQAIKNLQFSLLISRVWKGKKLQEKKNEINAHHDHVKAVAELKGLEMEDWEEQLL